MRIFLRALCVVLLLQVGGGGLVGIVFAQETPAPQRQRPDSLTIMTYNVLYATPDSATIRAIRTANADIVGLQEVSEPRLRHIAHELGYYYYHNEEHEANGPHDTGILSRYPISRPTRYGATIYLTVDDPIHVANVHLSAYPYQPYKLRDDELDPEEAVAEARMERLPEIQPVLEHLQDPVDEGDPVVLMGDFNEPSHLDWTPEAADAGLHLGLQVPWPTSRAIVRQGFRDAYREVYPDEVEHPGETWTTLTGDDDEVHDRIDIIYVAGETVRATDAYTIGLRDDPPTDVAVPGYPSDHRSVVTTVSLEKGADD
jgi:endonuclease/exonuclease/phosphatase family metal-dependent hydrolase